MELKQIRSDIPVILASGFNETIMSGNVKKFDVAEYLMKPYNTLELDMVIRQVMGDNGET